MEPRLEEAEAGKRTVFFVDAAHFVLSVYLGFLWCFTRVLVRAPSGRQRFNVLGALNAVTHQLITVTNDTYINSISVGQLLENIAGLGLTTPITLIMDNARYQRCKYVLDIAARLDIEILFLPPYSPNLNLIERLWKFVRKECRQCRASDLTGGDSLEENPLEQKGKSNPDETSKDIRECHKAFLSSRDTKMLGMSEANQASGNLITADSGHIT